MQAREKHNRVADDVPTLRPHGRPYGWLIGSAAGVHDDSFVDADALERMPDLAARSSVAGPSATR